MSARYRLADHGRTFSTRPRGAELRGAVLEAGTGADAVVIDCADVLSVSYSFADELVGELADRRPEVSWINASPEVERVLQRALANRRGTLTTQPPIAALTYL